MAAGRFGGDRLVGWLGPRVVLRVSSTIAVGGLGGALLLGTPLAAIIGFGLVGAGIANVIPILFSAAGRMAGPSRHGAGGRGDDWLLRLSRRSAPLIGLAAELTSLPVALGTVSAACIVIAVGARVLAPEARGVPSCCAALEKA
jgi:hypothetical protein